MIYCSGNAVISFKSSELELSIEKLIFSSYTSCLNNAVENQQDGPLNIGKV